MPENKGKTMKNRRIKSRPGLNKGKFRAADNKTPANKTLENSTKLEDAVGITEVAADAVKHAFKQNI
jgi:hypothetical protein